MKEIVEQFSKILESKGLCIETKSLSLNLGPAYKAPNEKIARLPLEFRCVLLAEVDDD